jgi:excisionase family DNA binding protein
MSSVFAGAHFQADLSSLRHLEEIAASRNIELRVGETITEISVETLKYLLSAIEQAVDEKLTERFLTTQQAAKQLGVSRPTLIKLLEQQNITTHSTGSHRRISETEVERLKDYLTTRRSQGLQLIRGISEFENLYESTIDTNPFVRN